MHVHTGETTTLRVGINKREEGNFFRFIFYIEEFSWKMVLFFLLQETKKKKRQIAIENPRTVSLPRYYIRTRGEGGSLNSTPGGNATNPSASM
jgi:hypothetical protein